MTPELRPEEVRLSAHAAERYLQRRRSRPSAVERGLRRLLSKAALQPVPPIRDNGFGHCRPFRVGDFVLILDPDLTTLITILRVERHKESGVRAQRSGGRSSRRAR